MGEVGKGGGAADKTIEWRRRSDQEGEEQGQAEGGTLRPYVWFRIRKGRIGLKAEASTEKQGRRGKIYIYIYLMPRGLVSVSNLVEAKPRECCFPLTMKSWATFVLKKKYICIYQKYIS